MTVGGQVIGVFRYGTQLARPIVWPLVGPDGLGLTRDWPMSEANADDSRDHPHHQSFWVAHGDVNGVNHWSLAEGHGLQRVSDVKVGEEAGGIAIDAGVDWLDAAGNKQLNEKRKLLFWSMADGPRGVDLTCRFEMTEGEVRFGDTKEGGLCSVRMASALEEKRGGGRITNGAGGQGEGGCWGKPSPWCDYSGTLAGKNVGITILDHPANFRYPTTWHVRAYGLMTANPFGISFFRNDKFDGSYTWQKGDVVEWRYRVVLHSGDASAGGVAGWSKF